MRKGVSTQIFLLTPTLLNTYFAGSFRLQRHADNVCLCKRNKRSNPLSPSFCSFSFFKIFGPDPPRHQYGPFSVFPRVGRERREKYELIGEREAGRKSTLGQGGVAEPSHGGQEEGALPSLSLFLPFPLPPTHLHGCRSGLGNHSIRRKPIWFSLR